MAVEITSRKLRNNGNLEGSRFLDLYKSLILSDSLSDDEYQELLSFAVIFMRQGDPTVQKLGYRIILQYSLDTEDFRPLIDIADQREIMPILAAVKHMHPEHFDEESLRQTFSTAHGVNFATGDGIVRTREQLALQAFNRSHSQAAIIAPTSYGKSEMLIDRALVSLPGAVCIVVPSKALIAQTKSELMRVIAKQPLSPRVITHPEAYNSEKSFVAVLTQERLHRLFVDYPELHIDHLLVDEAQNILTDDGRSLELSQVILIARKRNPDLQIAYYTPFLENPLDLQHVNQADESVRARTASEQVKVERFFAGELGSALQVFDQFLDRGFETGVSIPNDPADAVLELAGERTIIYLNKPRHAQEMALQIAGRIGAIEPSPLAEKAIVAISDLVDKDYLLVETIRSGVLFHHGQIPEVLRQYVENLFREDDTEQRRYLVATSTLLEGVNTPADRMILFSPSKGRSYLARSSFRNLVGRVARFSQIFAGSESRLSLLLPKVYVIKSRYAPARWSPIDWLKDRADPAKTATDPVENPLLESGPNEQPRIDALERLENIEPGTSDLAEVRLALTEVGQLCFKHGAHDFDIFRYERLLQERVDVRSGSLATTADELITMICEIFLQRIDLVKNTDDLSRINEEGAARNFYGMFLGWRADAAPLKLMIARYLNFWKKQDSDWIWVGSRWGLERQSSFEHNPAYVRRSKMTRSELVNLAIVRIKAELDFLDYRLMKYLEILYALKLIEEKLYLKVKYGTEDEFVIAMLRNGLSFELARLISESYKSFVDVDTKASTVVFNMDVIAAMERDGVNDILLFEVRGLIGVQA